ncbi:hypothetical protein QVD17_03194 [Tagetes erecta]|uniref:Transferase, Chloramphenicol acetyltransferase-like domain protein n=1 Tax=Tagetes erecta TaxID=13708 RepID=A0AAD8P8G4_TARER|nr:hypothetical protein QVD17_03194 [Tagetes erecta]
MITSLIRFSRRHLIHTLIVSTQNIKPSFPTPSHLKTYNLSVCDQSMPNAFSPLVTFYPRASIYHSTYDQMLDLKNALSRTLTKYYPFAGRHAKIAPTFVDCNDHGAEFIEATVDSTLSDFLKNSKHEDLDQFFPFGRTWSNSSGHDRLQSDIVIPLAVKVNHFECGGLAVAVSLSHKVADAYSCVRFVSDWAKMTRACLRKETDEVRSINDPKFISFQNTSIKFSGFSLETSNDCVTRSFVFPNAKINELKVKVKAMTAGSGQPIINPTRVEVLTWLLYKCSIEANIKNNFGSFKPTSIRVATNIRDKMIEQLPENAIGNFLTGMEVQTTTEMDLKPEFLIRELRNQKKKIQSIKNVEAAFAPLLNNTSSSDLDLEELQRKFENAYLCTSVCRYPAYAINFGWGTPVKATLPGNMRKNSFLLMDTPNEDGIEVLVCLGKQDMDVIKMDPDILSIANIY